MNKNTENNGLFAVSDSARPLAERLRPKTYLDVVGQDHIWKNSELKRFINNGGRLPSFILWGPAGCGKTTIARSLANQVENVYFESVSAIFTGVADLKRIFDEIKQRSFMGEQTILFVDEIHRFNKTQQDVFLPYMEDGTITLIGATTENPSFSLNNALLSRASVLELNPLDEAALLKLIVKAEDSYKRDLPVTAQARNALLHMAQGDGRKILSICESIFSVVSDTKELDVEDLTDVLGNKIIHHDKSADAHYNLASALQKSIRGSDVQAAIYYTARMLEAGEDPKFILRRLQIIACEDIGMADPNALLQADATANVYERVGSPQGEIAIAQLVTYLATAPKSNSSYVALNKARQFVRDNDNPPPPKDILNAPTTLMKNLNYGSGYKYDHDCENAYSGQNFMPDVYRNLTFYHPNDRGFEKNIIKRLEFWQNLKSNK